MTVFRQMKSPGTFDFRRDMEENVDRNHSFSLKASFRRGEIHQLQDLCKQSQLVEFLLSVSKWLWEHAVDRRSHNWLLRSNGSYRDKVIVSGEIL